jgi:hypothetical protein
MKDIVTITDRCTNWDDNEDDNVQSIHVTLDLSFGNKKKAII